MSMPTVYGIKDTDGKRLGYMLTDIRTFSPLSRIHNREGFDIEVGQLIVTKLVVCCAQLQESTEPDKFTLADVASIKSSGGTVLAAEFADCVKAYIRYQTTMIEDPRVPAEGIQYFTSGREQAREVLAYLESLKITRQRPAPVAKPRNP